MKGMVRGVSRSSLVNINSVLNKEDKASISTIMHNRMPSGELSQFLLLGLRKTYNENVTTTLNQSVFVGSEDANAAEERTEHIPDWYENVSCFFMDYDKSQGTRFSVMDVK
ncbi:hypothetical protein STEG23_036157 [Scotinomys teguina]